MSDDAVPDLRRARPVAWARCPDDAQLLHLVTTSSVVAAASEGSAPTLCGQVIAAENLTLPGGAGTPCSSCMCEWSARAAARATPGEAR